MTRSASNYTASPAADTGKEDWGTPYTPYDIQLDFMRTLYRLLQQPHSKIGLFSSPTGTGKTMSLLCPTLKYVHSLNRVESSSKTDVVTSPNNTMDQLPPWVREYQVQQQNKRKRTLPTSTIEDDEDLLDIDTALTRARRKRTLLTIEYDPDLPYSSSDSCESDAGIDMKRRVSTSGGDFGAVEERPIRARVIFTSRTHSQLSQLLAELQKTTYSVSVSHAVNSSEQFDVAEPTKAAHTRVLALASRKHLCVHPRVSKFRSAERVSEGCRLVRQQGKCEFYSPVLLAHHHLHPSSNQIKSETDQRHQERLTQFQNTVLESICDIEDLARYAKQMRTCAYFSSRPLLDKVEFITAPYSMLLDNVTRKSCGLDELLLSGAGTDSDIDEDTSNNRVKNVIVIDEAHNLVPALCSLYDLTLTRSQVRMALEALEVYRKSFGGRLSGKHLVMLKTLLRVVKKLDGLFERVGPLLDTNKDGTTLSDQQDLGGEYGGKGWRSWNVGDFVETVDVADVNVYRMCEYLDKSKVVHKVHAVYDRFLLNGNKIDRVGLDDKLKKNGNGKDDDDKEEEGGWLLKKTPLVGVEKLMRALCTPNKAGRILMSKSTNQDGKCDDDTGPYLKFVLLDASDLFRPIVEKSHAVILAGGTMEPIEEFYSLIPPALLEQEGRVHRFECEHIIPPSNLSVIRLPAGPTKLAFDFRYGSRYSGDLLAELYRTLFNFATVTPGGMVVFFPSYEYLDRVVGEWRKSGDVARLERKKRVFVEPRRQAMMEKVWNEYVQECDKSIIRQHGDAATTTTKTSGAILFAVVGGKMSEGINFSNHLGRLVVMVGLPFPNPTDPTTNLLMRHADQKHAENPLLPNGQEYLENVCMKAVNQAIGRAIRHRGDYAAIVLLERRWNDASERMWKKVPKWMRRSEFTGNVGSQGLGFGPVMVQLSRFFKAKTTEAAHAAACS